MVRQLSGIGQAVVTQPSGSPNTIVRQFYGRLNDLSYIAQPMRLKPFSVLFPSILCYIEINRTYLNNYLVKGVMDVCYFLVNLIFTLWDHNTTRELYGSALHIHKCCGMIESFLVQLKILNRPKEVPSLKVSFSHEEISILKFWLMLRAEMTKKTFKLGSFLPLVKNDVISESLELSTNSILSIYKSPKSFEYM